MTKLLSSNLILLATVLLFSCSPQADEQSSDERIWVKARLNGKPVHLAFDSGSAHTMLFPLTQQKLGLSFTPAPTNWAHLYIGAIPNCALTFAGMQTTTTVYVLLTTDCSGGLPGFIGWQDVRQNLLQIDALAGRVRFLEQLPPFSAQWLQLPLATNHNILNLEIPRPGQTNGILCIDTGAPEGVALPPAKWHEWKKAHPHMPVTLDHPYSVADHAYIVVEEGWADRISIGPLVLTQVPVSCAVPVYEKRWGEACEGTLGLAALKRLNLLVDGPKGIAYLQPNRAAPQAYSHNRLGALFLPPSPSSLDLIAQVAVGGPAYEAGVRDGDILVQVNGVYPLEWTTDFLQRCKESPAGARFVMRLKRDGKPFTVTATLRDILKPSFQPNSGVTH